MAEGGLADAGTGAAVHGQTIAALSYDFDGALGGAGLLGEQGREAGGVRAAHGDPGSQAGAGELRGLLIGDESARVERDHLVGGARRLLGVGRGEQDRAALGGVCPQHAVQPLVLAGGEAVGGVVEQEGVRVRQQGAGQSEAAVHAAREGAEPFVPQADEADHLEDFVGTPDRDTRRGAQHAQVTAHGAGGMARHITQKHADFARGVRDAV